MTNFVMKMNTLVYYCFIKIAPKNIKLFRGTFNYFPSERQCVCVWLMLFLYYQRNALNVKY